MGKIKRHLVEYGAQEWHEFRNRGVGGSEIHHVITPRANEFSCAAKLFYEKLGEITPFREDNEAMYHGRNLEAYVKECWTRYNHDYPEGYIFNQDKLRAFRNVNGFVTNSDYPYLFYSPDGLITKDSTNHFTKQPIGSNGILEVKTPAKQYIKKFENEIDPSWIYQIHQGMMIMETDYSELVLFIDRRNLVVIPIQRNEKIVQRIVECSTAFWEDVLVARKAIVARDQAFEAHDEIEYYNQQAIIDMLEPDPDESDTYKEFLSERHKKEDEVAMGGQSEFQLAYKASTITALKKALEQREKLCKNTLAKFCVDNSVDKIDLGDQGNIQYDMRGRATSKSIYIYLKEKQDKEVIEEMVNELEI